MKTVSYVYFIQKLNRIEIKDAAIEENADTVTGMKYKALPL